MPRGGNYKSFEKPFTDRDVLEQARRVLARYRGDKNAAGRYARAMEDRYESAKWQRVVELLSRGGTL